MVLDEVEGLFEGPELQLVLATNAAVFVATFPAERPANILYDAVVSDVVTFGPPAACELSTVTLVNGRDSLQLDASIVVAAADITLLATLPA